jgi:hypothetical protein
VVHQLLVVQVALNQIVKQLQPVDVTGYLINQLNLLKPKHQLPQKHQAVTFNQNVQPKMKKSVSLVKNMFVGLLHSQVLAPLLSYGVQLEPVANPHQPQQVHQLQQAPIRLAVLTLAMLILLQVVLVYRLILEQPLGVFAWFVFPSLVVVVDDASVMTVSINVRVVVLPLLVTLKRQLCRVPQVSVPTINTAVVEL